MGFSSPPPCRIGNKNIPCRIGLMVKSLIHLGWTFILGKFEILLNDQCTVNNLSGSVTGFLFFEQIEGGSGIPNYPEVPFPKPEFSGAGSPRKFAWIFIDTANNSRLCVYNYYVVVDIYAYIYIVIMWWLIGN